MGADEVSMALSAARTRLSIMAMVERTIFLIFWQVYHVRIWLNSTNSILYMYLDLLLKYNARVAGGVQQHALRRESILTLFT
jgi:hypothetical protein